MKNGIKFTTKNKLMKIVFPKQPKRELKLRKSLSILGIESQPLKMGRQKIDELKTYPNEMQHS